jgi:hypothetical protein
MTLTCRSRCDREQPCSMCSARKAECTYLDNHTAATSSARPPVANSSVEDRIVHLERLVMSVMQNSSRDLGTNDRDRSRSATLQPRASEGPTPKPGDLRMNALEHQYVDSDHWTAIMTSFASLKEHFGMGNRFKPSTTHQRQDVGQEPLPRDALIESHTLLLFGNHRCASRAEIMSSLPPKTVVDRYIARYFNYQELVSCSSMPAFESTTKCLTLYSTGTIHGPTFLKEASIHTCQESMLYANIV